MTKPDQRTIRAEARRAQRRVEILDAAVRVFGENGYANTSVSDVIKAAGIARGTFYLYFDGRDALFHELIGDFVKEIIGVVDPVRPENDNAVAMLYENVSRVVHKLFDNPDRTRLLLREAVGIDDKVDGELEALDSYMHKMLVGALNKGAGAGWIREVANSEVVAVAIYGCLKEVLYQSLVAEKLEGSAEEIAQAIFDFGSKGLMTG